MRSSDTCEEEEERSTEISREKCDLEEADKVVIALGVTEMVGMIKGSTRQTPRGPSVAPAASMNDNQPSFTRSPTVSNNLVRGKIGA